MHHLPAHPAYLRVKVSRRLERIGSVALKNSVYVLPPNDETLEDFQWLRNEIERSGGEASLSVTTFVDEVTDAKLIASFREARDADYEGVAQDAADLAREWRASPEAPLVGSGPSRVNKLRSQMARIRAIDFFQAPEGARARAAVQSLEDMLAGGPISSRSESGAEGARPLGRTWVTREGVKVDRICSAWLIRRFIDPDARFKFVPASGYEPQPGELRFDMFAGEFTHVGDDCTFETLLKRFELQDPALTAIGEIVHDIDIKDERYGRPETAGVASLISGIRAAWPDDPDRVERAGDALDGLVEHFRSQGA